MGAGAADPTSTCINTTTLPLNPWSRGETGVQGYKVGIGVVYWYLFRYGTGRSGEDVRGEAGHRLRGWGARAN